MPNFGNLAIEFSTASKSQNGITGAARPSPQIIEIHPDFGFCAGEHFYYHEKAGAESPAYRGFTDWSKIIDVLQPYSGFDRMIAGTSCFRTTSS